jgi:hypothetical protein
MIIDYENKHRKLERKIDQLSQEDIILIEDELRKLRSEMQSNETIMNLVKANLNVYLNTWQNLEIEATERIRQLNNTIKLLKEKFEELTLSISMFKENVGTVAAVLEKENPVAAIRVTNMSISELSIEIERNDLTLNEYKASLKNGGQKPSGGINGRDEFHVWYYWKESLKEEVVKLNKVIKHLKQTLYVLKAEQAAKPELDEVLTAMSKEQELEEEKQVVKIREVEDDINSDVIKAKPISVVPKSTAPFNSISPPAIIMEVVPASKVKVETKVNKVVVLAKEQKSPSNVKSKKEIVECEKEINSNKSKIERFEKELFIYQNNYKNKRLHEVNNVICWLSGRSGLIKSLNLIEIDKGLSRFRTTEVEQQGGFPDPNRSQQQVYRVHELHQAARTA